MTKKLIKQQFPHNIHTTELTFRDKLHYVKERENRIFHLNGYLLAMELFKTLMLGLQKNFHFL